ncbi:SAM-dependent methyltransferase [Streptomyces noboritoensis]|uniref:SAM-dependent methyltransferase n=1 Tax=Streptomyces noboritoensis TaxID=67337 RepID=A0ABV6THH4_9ACTN
MTATARRTVPSSLSMYPSSARVTDHFLGGDDHFGIDRVLANAVARTAPYWQLSIMINRAHAVWATEQLTRQGFEQFLDLGCGYPPPWSRDLRDRTNWPLHQVVRRIRPEAAFVSVDSDPLVSVHARAAHAAGAAGDATFVAADATDVADLLGSPTLARLDMHRPIAVLLHDVLPWITDTHHVTTAMRALRTALPPGSALSLTHATADLHPLVVSEVADLFATAGLPWAPRPRRTIAHLLGDWPLLGRGLVPTAQTHRGHRLHQSPPWTSAAYAAIALHPRRSTESR